MSWDDRLFWGFVFTFYVGSTLLAIYLQESGLAAIGGIALGNAIGIFQGIRTKRSLRAERE